jgi:branched-chain amino acid transport system substrate-binding protein
MIRPIKTVCVGIVFLSTLASWAIADPAATPPEKLKIGMLLTLSGSFASAGEDCRKGAEAGLLVAGPQTPIDLIYADTKNEPTTAITEFQRLVRANLVVGVYTHRSSIGMALNPISLNAQVPLLGAVGHRDFARGNNFAFQIWPRSEQIPRS